MENNRGDIKIYLLFTLKMVATVCLCYIADAFFLCYPLSLHTFFNFLIVAGYSDWMPGRVTFFAIYNGIIALYILVFVTILLGIFNEKAKKVSIVLIMLFMVSDVIASFYPKFIPLKIICVIASTTMLILCLRSLKKG